MTRSSAYTDKTLVSSKFSKANYESLVALNAALKSQLMETKRKEVTYEQVLENAFFLEDVLKNS